jgi:putative flavoprotein involved in K+ transport
MDTVVVGGGQAGLAMSYHLTQRGREHVVLERGRIGEAWRSERWDSLVFQFPNWTLELPGYSYQGTDPDGFAPRLTVAEFLESYAEVTRAPVRSGVHVVRVGPRSGGEGLVVQTETGSIDASNVVVATGAFHRAAIPAVGGALPAELLQIHSKDYRSPAQLPPGATLVVGCGASGCQITEELYQGGRQVYLSVGSYRRAPRRYRDRDIFWWLDVMGIWDRPLDLYPDVKSWRVPLVTGVGGGHDIDLRSFAEDGVTLLGRVTAAHDGAIVLAPDLEQTLRQGDERFVELTESADAYVREAAVDLPEAEAIETSAKRVRRTADPILRLDLKASGITSVVWACGFQYDFGWVQLPVFDEGGEPVQHRGVTSWPGLYFLGLRRMYTLNSAILSGVGKDAAHLAEQIALR